MFVYTLIFLILTTASPINRLSSPIFPNSWIIGTTILIAASPSCHSGRPTNCSEHYVLDVAGYYSRLYRSCNHRNPLLYMWVKEIWTRHDEIQLPHKCSESRKNFLRIHKGLKIPSSGVIWKRRLEIHVSLNLYDRLYCSQKSTICWNDSISLTSNRVYHINYSLLFECYKWSQFFHFCMYK